VWGWVCGCIVSAGVWVCIRVCACIYIRAAGPWEDMAQGSSLKCVTQ